MNKKYLGIVVDLVNSRKLENEKRIFVHNILNEVLDKTNEEFDNIVLSNFTITLGDEFQGLVEVKEQVIDLLFKLYRELRTHEIVARFGIGYGEMTLPFLKNISIGSDGPAYHKAREAVERAKKTKKEFCFVVNPKDDDLMGKISSFYVEIFEKMNSKQKDAYLKLLEGEKIEKIVEDLDYNDSSLSRLSAGKKQKLDTYLVVLKRCIEELNKS
jgi:hypothetical protein